MLSSKTCFFLSIESSWHQLPENSTSSLSLQISNFISVHIRSQFDGITIRSDFFGGTRFSPFNGCSCCIRIWGLSLFNK
eukprot:UN01188